MLGSRRRVTSTVNVWPGYVDALSALLMLIIFMLLIFTLAQVFLAQTVSDRDFELDQLNIRLSEISKALRVQQDTNQSLAEKLSALRNQYNQGVYYQNALKEQIAELETTVDADKEKIKVQLSEKAQLLHDIITLREVRADLESEIAIISTALKNSDEQVAQLRTNLADLLLEIATVRDDRKVLAAKLAEQQDVTMLAQVEVAKSDLRIQDLVTIISEAEDALESEKELSTRAFANVKQLGEQIDTLKNQLNTISQALKLEEQKTADQEADLADLGERLNTLLAERINELEGYRSEFFGRLRQVLVANPNIRVEGDRFLLPSELFFSSASATLGEQGKRELDKLAQILDEISLVIPSDISWILRIDGHTDQLPINTPRFPSNWELSTARAVAVVRYLVQQGVPAQRLTAAGFGEFHPVDSNQSEEAYQRNRRIELKLTKR